MGCSNSAPAPVLAPSSSKKIVASTAPKKIVALTAAELEEAVARYSKTTVLRALLTHDPALGGVAIKLISVRWLITYFQANPSARLEHRQHLERTTPEAFVEGAKLERVLAELESGGSRGLKDMLGPVKCTRTCVYKAVTMFEDPVEIAFPSAAAMSHMCASLPSTRDYGEACGTQLAAHSRRALLTDAARRWLSKDHPDPHAKNLRDIWLPALEWYYSERVRQLTYLFGDECRAKDAKGKRLSDKAVKEAADFGVFIE